MGQYEGKWLRQGGEDKASGRLRVREWGWGRERRTLLFIKSHGSQLFVYHRRGGIWNTNETN